MKKRILSIMLTLCIVLMLVPTTAFAETSGEIDGFQYTISDAGEVTITDYNGSATTVEIPKQIDGNYVTSIGKSAFYGCTSLTSITIPNSVTSIGNNAFARCTSLTSITIPNGVTSIEYDAFAHCESLTSITIPNSVTSIGNKAFSDCTSLTSITIPNSITYIEYGAFLCCASLESITIPSSVKSIKTYAFAYCTRLTSITIPNSVTSIGIDAFMECTSLTSITIPNSVTSIGKMAFDYCTSLESIFLPDGLDVSNANIRNEATKVRYSLDKAKGEITITEIDLGTDKSKIDIPDTICGYPVLAVATSEQSKVGVHTHAGGKATCQTEATCGICNTKYGNIGEHSYTKEDKNIEGALKTAGTCQSEAIYYYSCEFCGDVEGDDNHTFTGDKAPDNHTGEKVWTKTETQHEQKWNCCGTTAVSLENHQWENGVCKECDYICVHKDENTDHKCDICGVTLSECKDENTDYKCDICGETLSNDAKAKTAVDNDMNSPKTGDNSHMALWITLFFVSGGILTVTGVYIKKKKRFTR